MLTLGNGFCRPSYRHKPIATQDHIGVHTIRITMERNVILKLSVKAEPLKHMTWGKVRTGMLSEQLLTKFKHIGYTYLYNIRTQYSHLLKQILPTNQLIAERRFVFTICASGVCAIKLIQLIHVYKYSVCIVYNCVHLFGTQEKSLIPTKVSMTLSNSITTCK